jgi:hypothetical protein
LEISFNTDITALFPREFQDDYDNVSMEIQSLEYGFINSLTQTFNFYTNNGTMTCTQSVNGGPLVDFGSAVTLETPFQYSYNVEGQTYFRNYSHNVSGDVIFSGEGRNTLSLSCSSTLGSFSRDYTYIVDTTKPQLSSFIVDNTTAFTYTDLENNQYIIIDDIDKAIYTTGETSFNIHNKLKAVNFIVTLDGTSSWIKEYFTLQTYYLNATGFSRNENKSPYFFETPINYSKNTSNPSVFTNDFKLKLPLFDSLDTIPLLSENFEEIEKGLFELFLDVSYFDKANNELEVIHTVFIDNSTPRFNFSGDVGGVVDDLKLIFSNTRDPTIILDFDAPDYRTHICEVVLSVNGNDYLPYLLGSGVSQSSFEFNLGEITALTNTDISTDLYKISVNCVDIFDKELELLEYSFVYDAESPTISEVIFSNGNSFSRFLPSKNGFLEKIEDGLTISLENTEQYGVLCELNFTAKNDSYYCNNAESTPFIFTGNGGGSLIELFSRDSRIDNTYSNSSKCSTNENFWKNPNYGEKQVISLNVTCTDLAGNSNSLETLIDVNHFNKTLVDTNFSYDGENIIPHILLSNTISAGSVLEFYELVEIEGVKVRSFIMETTLQQVMGGTWTQLTSTIDRNDLQSEDGNAIEIVVVLGSEEIIVTLIKDSSPPIIDISLRKLEDGILYDVFSIVDAIVFDETSNLEAVSILIFDGTSIEAIYSLTNGTLNSSYSSTNQPANPNSVIPNKINVSQPIFDLVSGGQYSLGILAIDQVGNSIFEELTFSVLETDLILLGATENPMVPNHHYTSSTNPSLAVDLTIEQEFSCSSGLVYGISSSGVKSPNQYTINFNSDYSFLIPTSVGFTTTFENIGMDFICNSSTDIYSKSFILTYDNTGIGINKSVLVNSNDGFYYPNSQGLILSSFSDEFRVTFENSEPYALCSVVINSNDDYDCDEMPIEFIGAGNFITSLNQVIFDTNFGENGLCIKTDTQPLGESNEIETQLDFSVVCNDVLDRSATDSFSVPIIYTPSLLLNARGNINSNTLYLEVDALKLDSNFHSFEVELNGVTYSLSYTQSTFNNGLFTYNLESIDISELDSDAEYTAVITLFESGVEIASRDVSFIYDTTPPSFDFSLTSYHEENTVYNPRFDFIISATDSYSGVDFLEIKEGSTQLFYKNATDLIINQTYFRILNEYSSTNPRSYGLKYLNPSNNDRITLTFISGDILGNTNSFNQEVLYFDVQRMILLSSNNAFAHSGNEYWLSTESAPTLKFFLAQNVSRCLIPGIKDFINLGDGEFELDLEPSDVSEESVSQFSIKCIEDGKISSYVKSLYLVDTLPDFTLKSEFGFLISEDIGLRKFTINSVAPTFIDDVSCKYSLNNGPFIGTSNGSMSSEHNFEINVSSYSSGSYSLDVSCTDLLGRIHTSEYQIEITQDNTLELSNFEISSSYSKQILVEESASTLESNTPYVITFNSNKRNVTCEYGILEGGFFNSIINFFSSLFGTTAQDIFSESPYQFNSDQFTLIEGDNEIFVLCLDSLTGDSVDYTFPISVETTSTEVGNVSITYSPLS